MHVVLAELSQFIKPWFLGGCDSSCGFLQSDVYSLIFFLKNHGAIHIPASKLVLGKEASCTFWVESMSLTLTAQSCTLWPHLEYMSREQLKATKGMRLLRALQQGQLSCPATSHFPVKRKRSRNSLSLPCICMRSKTLVIVVFGALSLCNLV